MTKFDVDRAIKIAEMAKEKIEHHASRWETLIASRMHYSPEYTDSKLSTCLYLCNQIIYQHCSEHKIAQYLGFIQGILYGTFSEDLRGLFFDEIEEIGLNEVIVSSDWKTWCRLYTISQDLEPKIKIEAGDVQNYPNLFCFCCEVENHCEKAISPLSKTDYLLINKDGNPFCLKHENMFTDKS